MMLELYSLGICDGIIIDTPQHQAKSVVCN